MSDKKNYFEKKPENLLNLISWLLCRKEWRTNQVVAAMASALATARYSGIISPSECKTSRDLGIEKQKLPLPFPRQGPALRALN